MASPFPSRPSLQSILLKACICLLATVVLHAAPRAILSEFLAENTSGLRDEDGDRSDWIEVANVSGEPLDIAGWRLTDNPSQRSKWVFPAGVVLPPGGRRTVFASGKNRLRPDQPLHANFSLRREGEYLALFPPDSEVPATEFRPAFPPQVADVSFGEGVRVFPEVLVDAQSPARIRIPSPNDSSLDWTVDPTGGDNDSGWTAGTAAVGYDVSDEDRPYPLLGYWTFDDVQNPRLAVDSSGRNAHGTLLGPAGYTPGGLGRTGQSGDRALELGAGDNGASVRIDAAARGGFDALTTLDRATVSLWTFGGPQLPAVNSVLWFDTGAASGDARNFMVHLPWSDGVIYFDTGGCCGADTRIARQEPDSTKWKGRWNHYVFLKNGPRKEIWQNGRLWHSGDSAAPLQAVRGLWLGSARDGTSSYPGKLDEVAVWAGALSPADIEALAAGTPATHIGSFRPWFATDLAGSMRGVSSRAQLRIPFTCASNAMPGSLQFQIRYDDGFVAWINGVEVLRRNAPVTRRRTKAESLTPEILTVTPPAGLLLPGTNLLCIEGLNETAGDGDFLLRAELRGAERIQNRFFVRPTPDGPNDTGAAGLTAAPTFSVARGFLQDPVNVTLTSLTPGASLRYTQDGSEPSPTHGVSVGPDSITGQASVTIPVTRSQPLRAVAYRDDFEPSTVQTHTYLFAGQVERQPAQIPGYPSTWGVYGAYGPIPGQPVPADYEIDPEVVRTTTPGYTVRDAIESLPALCLTTSISNLFDPTTGIYPNSASQGSQWERPASAELVFPDGRPGFQIDAGVRIHGGLSRQHWHALKHSFRLSFSRDYGPPRLEFRLFDDSRVTSFNELTLRASSTDGWSVEDAQPWTRPKATYLRDVWMKDTQQALGWPCGHSRYVHLFLNGVYWGQYNLAERTEEVWLSENEGGDPEEYDIIKDEAELEHGQRDAWNQMIALARSGLSSDAAYWRIQGRRPDGTRDPELPVYLDVDSLIDYMILHIYSGAIDWPNHNWWSARRRGPSSPGFRFYTWDQEISNLSLSETRTYTQQAFEEVSGPEESPAFLYARLRANARFRERFASRVTALTSGFGILTPTQNAARWERRQAEIDRSIVAESARWGDSRQRIPLQRSHWLTEMNWMRTVYWPRIHATAIARFRRVTLYGLPTDSQVLISPRGGVVAPATAITLTGGSDLYFTTDGTDPVGPDGEPTPSAQRFQLGIPVLGPLEIRAQRRLATGWSPVVQARFLTAADIAPESSLEVSEIHYHPVQGDAEQFLELWNRDSQRHVILGGARISGGIDAAIPNGWALGPRERRVLIRDRAAFESRYGPDRPVAGQFQGALARGGEPIHLLGPSGRVVDRFHYGDSGAWPTLADGRGRSLTRRSSVQPLDPNQPSSWRPSVVPDGSPGWDDSLAPIGPVDAGADADGDGWSAVEELFWGARDSDPTDTPQGRPHLIVDSRTGTTLELNHPLAADAVEASWEQSEDLSTWQSLPVDSIQGSEVTGDREVIRWLLPPSEAATQFYRLRLKLR